MSELINKFKCFSEIEEEIKTKIKLFHVFDDVKGNNVLFITSDDKVFGFGSNCFGCCGLGHNSVVNEPQIIPELCHNNIQQFFIGGTFRLCLTNERRVYGWGRNYLGQLGRGITNEKTECLKPGLVAFPFFESVIQLSCGTAHSLALTCEGKVFGWGSNILGQVGSGKETGPTITTPIEIKYFNDFTLKSINCIFDHSYALTTEGLVYRWGRNENSFLGFKSEDLFVPQLIENIGNVIKICPSYQSLYFLTNECEIYFWGKSKDENNCETFQTTPKLLESEKKFTSLHSIPYYQKSQTICSAITDDSVYHLIRNTIQKLDGKTFFDFYSTKYELSHKSIEIKPDLNFDGNDLSELNVYRIFNQIYKSIILGSCTFGDVFRAQNKFNFKTYAIKRISYTSKFNLR